MTFLSVLGAVVGTLLALLAFWGGLRLGEWAERKWRGRREGWWRVRMWMPRWVYGSMGQKDASTETEVEVERHVEGEGAVSERTALLA